LYDNDKLILLGKLMNESQASCRDPHECSCPQIDEITELARKNGAYGSRLTGAGWGGCTVSLVDAHHSDAFIRLMIEQHYNAKP
jgi:galactokinase